MNRFTGQSALGATVSTNQSTQVGQQNHAENRSGYRVFIMPTAHSARIKTNGERYIAHDSKGYGLLLGAETQLNQSPWTVGAHVALGTLDLKAKDWSADGESQVYGIGLHALYVPDSQQGFWANGLARVSYVKDELKRHIQIGDYSATHRSSWSGRNGVLGAKAGYRFALNESLGFSPVLSLDYTHLKRSSHHENGPEATRLGLKNTHLNSLRAGAGVELDWSKELLSGNTIQANLALNWRHKLLNKDIHHQAHFMAALNISFSNRHQLHNRQALNLQAGLNYQVSQRFELGAHISHDWYRKGGRNVAGHLPAKYRF